MKTEEKLKRVFALLLGAVKKDSQLAAEIDRLLGDASGFSRQPSTTGTPSSSRRRKKAAFDPFIVYQEGEAPLRARLAELGVEDLKDIVAEYGMDSANLVLKWRTPERIIDHIAATVQSRSKKGDAFRS